MVKGRSSHRKCSMKKAVHKNFAIFTGKHLCWCYFLIKLQAWKTGSLLKRDSNGGIFLWILRNFLNTYFEEHLRLLLKGRYWFSTNEILKFYHQDIMGFFFFFQLIFFLLGFFCYTVDYFTKKCIYVREKYYKHCWCMQSFLYKSYVTL